MSTKNASRNQGSGQGEIDLSQQFRQLLSHKYPIAAAVLAGAFLGALYSFTSTPVYRADAMLEIETKQNQILTEINSMFSNEPSPSEVEIELVQSRLVVGKTVDDLHLDQVVKPKYFPLLGRMLHNLSSDIDPQLTLHTFTVETEWLNQPIILKATDNKHYTLKLPDGTTAEGTVGQALRINPQTTIQVNQILAESGQEFALIKNTKLSAIQNIYNNLSVISKGKTSPIINLGYTGTEPEEIQRTLNSIIDNYISQNKDRDIQVAAAGLAFISEELPRLKRNLEDAENRLNEYRTRSGSLDIPVEAKGALESLVAIETQITGLKTEEAGLAELYTPAHPAYKAVLDKLSVLNQAKNKINRQISELPNIQQEVIRLTRDVDTNQATYVQLLNKQQELNIMQASAQGNVRVVDHAMTAERPIKPRKAMITLLSALTAGMLASAWYLFRGAVRRTLTSPDEIEALNLEVLAIIPKSDAQAEQSGSLAKLKKPAQAAAKYLLAQAEPTDVTVEAIRSLRTSIYFSIMDAKNNILMISGATPEAGKSFIAANLAIVMAQSEKKVLLIDADMRKGYLDQLFEAPVEQGLAEILSGQITPSQAVQPTQTPNLDIITHGTLPDNPSELLMSNRLRALLEWAKPRYDHIIIDTPPVLSVTDATIIGQMAGITLLVARYESTTALELDRSAAKLVQNNVPVKGVIFNGLDRNAQDVYSYYAYAKYVRKS